MTAIVTAFKNVLAEVGQVDLESVKSIIDGWAEAGLTFKQIQPLAAATEVWWLGDPELEMSLEEVMNVFLSDEEGDWARQHEFAQIQLATDRKLMAVLEGRCPHFGGDCGAENPCIGTEDFGSSQGCAYLC